MTGATDDSGARNKATFLASGLQRMRKKLDQGRNVMTHPVLVGTARRARVMKRASQLKGRKPDLLTFHEGMRPVPTTGMMPLGAIDAEGHRLMLDRPKRR